MACPRHSLLKIRRGGPAGGLVLVEVMLLMLVLGLAVVLVSLALGRMRHRARLQHFGADVQAIAGAFSAARAERGQWPATAEEAGDAVLAAGWADGPAIGGDYGWHPPAAGRPGLLTVTAFVPAQPLDLSPADLLVIDRSIDDGDLATGRFRTGFNGWPVYLVAEKP
jgi:type II secretory pathway pseudopilin PulG